MTYRPRFAVAGNPGSRRVTLFAAAARAAGLPRPRVLPWSALLASGPGAGGGVAVRPGEVLRVDSPGEDAEVDRLLRGDVEPARVEGGARWYGRFTAAVRDVAAGAVAAGADVLDDPEELAVLFDKRRCHGRLAAADVPVPPSPTSAADAPGPYAAAPSLDGWDGLRDLLAAHGLRRAFVKPAHGSSAAGVLALEFPGRGRIRATTSVEPAPDGRLYNSLKVRRYTREAEVAAIVDALAPDGLHVERWLPKAQLGGRSCDLRVVVVAGRATHAVARTGASPMTNLHLGGARGDLGAVRAAAGPRWAAALAHCERAAACFPGTLCVGVDLLAAPGWRRFAVAEVNAFGDLLPGLTGLPGGGAEGLDTYAAQVAAVRDRYAAVRSEEHRRAPAPA
ncbi:STM4014 family protein [Streptomyces sp. MAR4 CNX-425]|uniref:STM4014 family protein n=1 Tax=Streptomyces sp. MAR4 CNX-425 TaxID=3406343 RepID=UPI003B506AD7